MVYDTNLHEIVYDTTQSKTFVIPHPDDPQKYLVHACLEGPEAGVYYRGQGTITNGHHVTIHLPSYVKHLAYEYTIQITQIYDGAFKTFAVGEVSPGEATFDVFGENGRFYWLVHGKRANIETEPLVSETQLKGDGPYKWI